MARKHCRQWSVAEKRRILAVNKSDNDMNSFLGLSICCATFERDSGNRRVTFYGIDKLIEANSKRNGRRQHKNDLLSRLPGFNAPYASPKLNYSTNVLWH